MKNIKEEPILWNRKIDCGHWRATTLAFMVKNYSKPKVGDKCYCRECCNEGIILKVKRVS